MKSFLIVAALLAAAAAASTGKSDVRLPGYFPTPCARGSPDLNKCIRKNMQFIMPLLGKGEKMLDFEPIEPIAVSDVRVHIDRDPFNFHAVARNSKVHGVSGIVIREARAKLADEAMDMELDVFFPKMVIEGDFKIEGKFGNFPFSGRGPWNVTIADLSATWHLIGQTVTKDGEKYMEIKRFIPEYTVGGMKAYAENLVEGAPALTELAMSTINNFWQPAMESFKPAMQPELERHMKRMANSVMTNVPYKLLFPAA